MPLTRVGTPPLITAQQTLLTILIQTQNINTTVVGQNRRTVISLDMGLYQPAKKLQMTCQDLDFLASTAVVLNAKLVRSVFII